MRPVARLRRKLGVTQAALAHELGVTHQTVSHYESGRRQPTVAVAWRILRLSRSRRCGLTLEDLLPDPAVEE